MAQLLVSVRSAEEAATALAGGAHLIDVKEPARGSLGRADATVVDEVVRLVAGRRPVSAAFGELLEPQPPHVPEGLSYIKWGLAGCESEGDWRHRLLSAKRFVEHTAFSCQPTCVAVAYADHQRASAPTPVAVVDFASANGWQVLLVDTWRKDGTTLLDWLSLGELASLRRQCRASEIRIALAGSLGVEEIEQLRRLEPDWFAVRGAACREGQRTRAVCAEHVGRLVRAL